MPSTIVNSKWMTDLNVGEKTMRLLQENIVVNLSDLGIGRVFLDVTLNIGDSPWLYMVKQDCKHFLSAKHGPS